MDTRKTLSWRLHLKSPPAAVHAMFASDKGREQFWSEKSVEKNGQIEFEFINGQNLTCRILRNEPSRIFAFEYFDKSKVTVELVSDGSGGTDLTLKAKNVKHENEWPGWVSVLLALKAAVDYKVDIRNHDGSRTWDQGYCDN